MRYLNKKRSLLIAALFAMITVCLFGLSACTNGNCDCSDRVQPEIITDESAFEVQTLKVITACVTIDAGSSHGAGVLISDDGYVLTNNHVVSSILSLPITVKVLNNDRKTYTEYSAVKVKNKTWDIDATILKLQNTAGRKFKYVKFGDSDKLQWGESAIIIGYPKHINLAVASARVANPSHQLTMSNVKYDTIMLDASINSGNSGGGVFNLSGEYVGMVSWRQNTSASDQVFGIGYAQKSNDLKAFINNNSFGVRI